MLYEVPVIYRIVVDAPDAAAANLLVEDLPLDEVTVRPGLVPAAPCVVETLPITAADAAAKNYEVIPRRVGDTNEWTPIEDYLNDPPPSPAPVEVAHDDAPAARDRVAIGEDSWSAALGAAEIQRLRDRGWKFRVIETYPPSWEVRDAQGQRRTLDEARAAARAP